MRTVPPSRGPECWHVLTESSVPVAEFASALSTLAPVFSWVPHMSHIGLLRHRAQQEPSSGSASLCRIHFPVQRGYSRLPAKLRERSFRKVLESLAANTAEPARSALVCTSSFWAPVAESWAGPVIYYATDFTVAYHGLSAARVLAADRALCGVANLVCPNSARLANFFISQARCDAEKLVVLPNATRAANVRLEPCDRPATLPEDVGQLPRPIAGVIGNMSDNLDWELVCSAMELVPAYTWLFVGPTSDRMFSPRNRKARARAMRSPRSRFIGSRPYAELFRYARALDVAVMPYDRIDPTYSGSATRFYEHLAATRPMLATRGVEELLHKEPLVTLVDGAEELAAELRRRLLQPQDGREEMRRLASQAETWEHRASVMCDALMERWSPGSVKPLRS